MASASLCDVMVPASFLIPERMQLRRGRIEVDTQVGCLRITPDDKGPHVYTAARLEEGSYRCQILRTLLSVRR